MLRTRFHVRYLGVFGSYVQGTPQRSSKKTIYAVVRAFEIIGEAAKKVPPSVRKRHAKVPWKLMAGMRDKLIHEYFRVNYQVLWKTAQEDIPPVRPLIAKVLEEESNRARRRR
jgi:uncharacterized protein with HEPN domain